MASTLTTNQYGAALPLIPERGVSSKYKVRYGVQWPWAQRANQVVPTEYLSNSNQAGYVSKAAGLSLIKNNVHQLLSTQLGQRVMLADYGINLTKFLFEPVDETTFMLIREEIYATLAKYFSTLNILSLKVFSPAPGYSAIIIQLTLQLFDESLEAFDIGVKIG